jgi:hypothetical protein
MSENAINAMLAHQSRAGVDATYFRELIEGYTFATYAKVTKYSNGRVDVLCGKLKFTNVEVLVLGVNGWGIKPVPAVGDRVLLISSQSPIVDIKTFISTGTMPPYDVSGLKAIPVCDDVTATQLITVDKDKIKITGPNKVTVDNSGIQFEDSNGNKISTTTNGVFFEDKFKNKVDTTTDGVSFEDKFKNKVDTTTDGVSFEDKFKNKVDTTTDGVSFEDKFKNKVDTTTNGVSFEDKNKNKVDTTTNGVSFEDKNKNKITTASSGITIEDKNGCKIVTSSSSVKINGKLEIKK